MGKLKSNVCYGRAENGTEDKLDYSLKVSVISIALCIHTGLFKNTLQVRKQKQVHICEQQDPVSKTTKAQKTHLGFLPKLNPVQVNFLSMG